MHTKCRHAFHSKCSLIQLKFSVTTADTPLAAREPADQSTLYKEQCQEICDREPADQSTLYKEQSHEICDREPADQSTLYKEQ